MRKIISALMAGFGISIAAAAAQPVDPEIYTAAVELNEQAGTLTVTIEFQTERLQLSRDAEELFTPMIFSAAGTDSLALATIRICGRNRWYSRLRNGELDGPTSDVFRAGKEGVAVVSSTVELQPWMEQSVVELRRQGATCCRRPALIPGTSERGLTEIARINTTRPDLIEQYVFAPPVDNAPVEKNIKGSAFVSFVVNRTELKPDYMINRSEIAKIINSIDFVRNDSDAIITGIHIKGFASPEGSYANNTRLAMGRTRTLTDYVRDYSGKYFNLPDSIFTNSFEPEDWAGLRRYMTDSLSFNIAHRPEIIALIDSPIEPDAKNDMIKRMYPADYKVILSEIYPWLRHSDYSVNYRIRVYTDLKDLMRLYSTDPTSLRPVDFYTIAGQYGQASPEYSAVMRKAAEIYPDDPMLNLNAANVALQANDLALARKHLLKAGVTPEADFARGVIAARQGNYADAVSYFTGALEGGVGQAADYLANIEAIRKHTSVTITARTTKETETDNK